MLKHIKFPFLVSSTRSVLTHGAHFMRRKRIFVMEIRDSNTGGEEGALDLFFLSTFESPLVGKLVKYFSQCYGKTYIRLRKRWGNGGPFDWFAAN